MVIVKKDYGKGKLAAFTLTELMVVLIIIGILSLLALPKLSGLINEAYSVEAEQQLAHVHTLQQKYFWEKTKFSDNLYDIRFEHAKLITEEGGEARYQIEIVEATPTTFLARATAVVDFDSDGILNVWEIDQEKNLREVTRD